MQVDNDTLSGLIGSIYDCALDRELWVPTLERLADLFEACSALMLSQGVPELSFGYDCGVPDQAKADYATRFEAIDPMRTMDWHFDVDDPITLSRFMDPGEFRRTAFYREYAAPLDWSDFITVILEKSATQVFTMGFSRNSQQGCFGAEESGLLRLLAPHVRRATIFHGIVEREAARAANLAAALDLLQTPILLFDSAGTCVEANGAAETFLAETDALRWDHRRIRARERVVDAELAAAITANPGPSGSGGERSLSFAFSQADGRKFAAHVLPLTGEFRERMGGRPQAVAAMFVQPVGELQPLPGEVLVKLYGLTHAETRLIGLLAADETLEEAAALLGVARATVRTHLRHIFEKTGTSRQSELMKLVLSALPRPAPPVISARAGTQA